jgi:hypothetical protein
MMQEIVGLAAAIGLALGAYCAALYAVFFAHRSGRDGRRSAEGRTAECEKALAALQCEVENWAKRLERVQEQAPQAGNPVPCAFNLSKRSQALRMHRRGDAPEQIALALGISCQEVHLLLKVHQIVVEAA